MELDHEKEKIRDATWIPHFAESPEGGSQRPHPGSSLREIRANLEEPDALTQPSQSTGVTWRKPAEIQRLHTSTAPARGTNKKSYRPSPHFLKVAVSR
jgi:hypothetical protein